MITYKFDTEVRPEVVAFLEALQTLCQEHGAILTQSTASVVVPGGEEFIHLEVISGSYILAKSAAYANTKERENAQGPCKAVHSS